MQPLESHFNQSTINDACAEASPSTAQQSNSSSFNLSAHVLEIIIKSYI